MRDMPLPFELEGKGGVGFLHKFCRDFAQQINSGGGCGGFGGGDWGKLEAVFGVSGGLGVGLGVVCEPTSVLETKRSPSPSSVSTTTLSSSLAGGAGGGGGSTDTVGVATVSGNPSEKWPQGHPQNHHQEISNTHSTDNSGSNSSNNNNNVEASGGGGMAKKDEWVNLDLFQQISTNLDAGAGSVSSGGAGKCGTGTGLEYWDTELLGSAAASPGQDQSILRLIMGDVEDPLMGLNKLLQGSGPGLANPDFQFGAGGLVGVVDQGFGLDPVGVGVASATAGVNNLVSNTGNTSLSITSSNSNNKGGGMAANEHISPVSNPPMLGNLRQQTSLPPNPIFTSSGNSSFPISLPLGQLNHHLQQNPPQNPHSLMFDCSDEKSHVLNHPQLLISQLQAQDTQNPAFFLPLPHNQLDQHLPLPSPPKRHNPGTPNRQIPKLGLPESGQLPLVSCPQQLHLLPYMQQQHRPVMATKPKMAGDEMLIQQQAIEDQLQKAAKLVETGNPILAQEILARLNHQLPPIGKPFYRAAFYFKEALRLLLMNNPLNSSSSASPLNLFLKIGAYKSFSEISPLVQFANFSCNQAILEALEVFDQIRILDFDIGYGGQWASLMQELAMRKGAAPSVKITAFASPTTHDQLELSLTRENLIHFAQEINMSFEFEIINLDYLNSASSWRLPFHASEHEAIAVNLPVSSLFNSPVSPTMILRFIKQLSPKIVASVDRGCDRNDLPFAHHFHQAFQTFLVLLESLEAVNIHNDALQKIETFLIRPGIEKVILGRHASPEKMQHWKNLFLSAGFSPLNFSNFTECQAEWLLKRTMAGGFHVEKRQSSLVLYWQRKELISASAWR